VRDTLGDALWSDFVAHANACDKDAFLSAFRKPILRCVGPPHGGACPRYFNIDVTCARAYVTLGELHLDHEQDLVVTCDMWHVGAGARGAPAPARARGTTASTARFCSTCSSPVHATTRRRRGGDAALPLRACGPVHFRCVPSSLCRYTAPRPPRGTATGYTRGYRPTAVYPGTVGSGFMSGSPRLSRVPGIELLASGNFMLSRAFSF
jgi:hypothetical protein